MKVWVKVLLGILLSFMCVFTSLGYAGFTSQMLIAGSAELTPPEYDSIVVTNVRVVSSTASSQSTGVIPNTNVKFNWSAKKGNKIVYEVTAHNYSETETFVYTGAFYDSEYSSIGNKVTISSSSDANNTNKIPASSGTNYYEGIPVEPEQEIVFYVTCDFSAQVSGEMMINFKFIPVVYSVTYLANNEIYAIDCIVDNSIAYTVKKTGPDNGSMVFASWVNANGQAVSSYPAGNKNSYTLSAKWQNLYLIIFVDQNGDVLYQETLTSSSTKLSNEGQATVDAILAQLNAEVVGRDMKVTWSDYTINKPTSNITVRPVYTYSGNLQYTPVDEDGDGIIDYYQLDAVASLEENVLIFGEFNGLDVKVVNKLYDNDGTFDYSSGVKTVTIEEGVQILNHNSLAYTQSLNTVYLPSTITKMEKNVFSRNLFIGSNNDKKVLTIYYNGTMAQWKALVNASEDDWHNGLLKNSKVICTDGYFELTNVSILGKYTWTERPN